MIMKLMLDATHDENEMCDENENDYEIDAG